MNGGTVDIQTGSQDAEGQHNTIIRGCSKYDDLLEMYFGIEVKKNTNPDFVKDVQTTWKLNVGDKFEYKLPGLTDTEKNDDPEVFINTPNKRGQTYPPFMYYNNDTKSIQFNPHSIWYQGRTYNFQIQVKERNSDTNVRSYFATVKMNGPKLNPETYLNFTDITFSMSAIDRKSSGVFKWSHPVNLKYVQDHWDELFDVYVKNVTYRQHNVTQ